MTDRCPRCNHAAHKKACRAKGPSGCQYLYDDDGNRTGIVCGARPPCPCPLQVCKCGLPVAVASITGTDLATAVVQGSACDLSGTLAVRKNPDGSLACREISASDELQPGEWRGVEHLEWPDHGPTAAKYNAPAEVSSRE